MHDGARWYREGCIGVRAVWNQKRTHSCQRGDVNSTRQDGGEWKVRRAEGADQEEALEGCLRRLEGGPFSPVFTIDES